MTTKQRGQGGRAPASARAKAAAPNTVERMLTSVPALRGAGLDKLADSIEATARELGVGAEAEPESPSVEKSPAQTADPDVETRGAQVRSAGQTLLTHTRHGIGGAIVVALAGAGRIGGSLDRGRRAAGYRLMRRRELVWGVLAAVPMSLLVGWVITRIP